MKWMIWPRQYGKTYEVEQWFLARPINRVVITSNEELARLRRRALEYEMPDIFRKEWLDILKSHIVSFRTWRNMRGVFQANVEIAIDGIDDMVGELFWGDVKIITGVGSNELPDLAIAAKAAEMHAYGINPLQSQIGPI